MNGARSPYEVRLLSDVCTTSSGGTPSRSKPEYFGGGIPWIKSGDLKDDDVHAVEETLSALGLANSSAKVLPKGTLLLAMYGATVGKLGITQVEATTNQAICGIQPSSVLDLQYLFYFLLWYRPHLINMSVGGAQPNISQKLIREILVPVPPLTEQRRAVDLIQRAESIVRMRREAEAKAKEIIPALFLDMFGDPATNPKGWAISRLGDVVKRLEGGKNVQAGAVGDSRFRILKISAVTSGTYVESEAKPAPAGFDPPAHYIVRDGDILFSRANTETLVGATAMVDSTDGKSLLPDKLWRLVWRPAESVAPAYILALLQDRSVRRELSKMASGTGGSMKNISQAKLLELKLPIAPVTLQHCFQRRVSAVRGLLGGACRAGEVAEQAFQALLTGAFGAATDA